MNHIESFVFRNRYRRNAPAESASMQIPAFTDLTNARDYGESISTFIAYLIWKERCGFMSVIARHPVILKKIDDFISRYDQSTNKDNDQLNDEAKKWGLNGSTLDFSERNAQIGLTQDNKLVIVWDGVAFTLSAVQHVVDYVLLRKGDTQTGKSLACLVGLNYHNMRCWSATNGSPIEFYTSFPKAPKSANGEPLRGLINAECFASLVNNQNYLKSKVRMDWVFTKNPADKLVDSYIKGSWPSDVYRMLDTVENPVILWINPPFIADVMQETAKFIIDIRKKYPNVVIRTCFPTWDDLIEPLFAAGNYHQVKYESTKQMRNGNEKQGIAASFYIGWFTGDSHIPDKPRKTSKRTPRVRN